jgi:hypothetical protein
VLHVRCARLQALLATAKAHVEDKVDAIRKLESLVDASAMCKAAGRSAESAERIRHLERALAERVRAFFYRDGVKIKKN